MIYEKWGNMKYKYRNREFWCRGYYVDTVGKNTKKIQEYIAHQLEEDKAAEQLTLDTIDPFTSSRNSMRVADRTCAADAPHVERGLCPYCEKPPAKLVDTYSVISS